jgi:putative spermidine/putrescine transport system permease protein/spermidine/putrescine transport system permease protein
MHSAALGTELNADRLRRAAFKERLALFGLCSPALMLVMVIVVVPAAWLFWLSFVGQAGVLSLENYQRMLDHAAYATIFWLTIKVAFLTTAICVLAGYPLAYFLSQIPARVANVCMIAVLVPFWTSLLVRTYAWLILLQRHGLVNDMGMALGLWDEPLSLVNNLGGTLVGMSHIMLPFLVLPVYGTMKAIDRDYPRAAAGLGASPVDVFLKVFFPLSLPGLFAGMLIVFIMCLGFYVTPAILGGGKIILVSMGIATNIQLFVNWGAASALGVVLFGVTLLILFGASFVMRVDQMFDRGHMQ